MIATPMITANRRTFSKKPGDLFRLSDSLRKDAADEIRAAMSGASVKRIELANVPGAGAIYLSRAQNGCECNPLWRLASIFIVGRILGIPKARFQRLLDWLQGQLDRAYGDADERELSEVLDRDAELDPRDDHLRFRAAQGCPDALRALLDEKRQQAAFAPTVIATLRHRIEATQQS